MQLRPDRWPIRSISFPVGVPFPDYLGERCQNREGPKESMKRMPRDEQDVLHAEPLTRRNAQGQLYERAAAVQQEIEMVLCLEPEPLIAAAGDLRDETLVCLIRERLRAQDWSVANRLWATLMERCRHVLLRTFRSFPKEVRDEAIRTVMEQLYSRIAALDSDRGDFFQVRFGLALKRLGTTQFQQCVWAVAQRKLAECDACEADSRNAPFDPYQWPEDTLAYSDAWKGLEAIKDDRHRMAFVLDKVHEMPVESDDPEAATISRYFRVSSRTIRNWLNQAKEDLAQWRKGKS